MSNNQRKASYRHAGVDEKREQKTLREAMLPWFEQTRLGIGKIADQWDHGPGAADECVCNAP